MPDRSLDATSRPPLSIHPSVFMTLIIPFGAVGGYVQVAMAFLATRRGLTVDEGALLIASGMFPHVWKFFWAPIADTTLTRKRWYLISAALCAVGIVAMAAIPLEKKNLLLLEAVIFLANLASTFLGMSVEGLMAHVTPPEKRGRVGGWFQAGNLGGSGLGGGAGLWMATHLPSESSPMPIISGIALGLAFLAGCTALVALPDAGAEERPGALLASMKWVAIDFWRTIKTRAGCICALLCILPIGTGAATGVLAQATVAAKWGVEEGTVSLVNGVMNGVVAALGCLVGGEVCMRINSRWAYALFGLLMAGVAATMALAPFSPTNYVVYILLYAFVTGLSYAAFTGFVLDAIGKGAAATKYNAFASLSNTPIMYMGLVLAWAFEPTMMNWGAKGMLLTEAGAGVLGILVLAAAVPVVRRLIREPAAPAIAGAAAP